MVGVYIMGIMKRKHFYLTDEQITFLKSLPGTMAEHIRVAINEYITKKNQANVSASSSMEGKVLYKSTLISSKKLCPYCGKPATTTTTMISDDGEDELEVSLCEKCKKGEDELEVSLCEKCKKGDEENGNNNIPSAEEE